MSNNGHCPWQTQNFWISRPNNCITATKSRLHTSTPAKQETKNKETQQTNCTRGSWVWVGNQRKGRHGRMRSLPPHSLPSSSLPFHPFPQNNFSMAFGRGCVMEMMMIEKPSVPQSFSEWKSTVFLPSQDAAREMILVLFNPPSTFDVVSLSGRKGVS